MQRLGKVAMFSVEGVFDMKEARLRFVAATMSFEDRNHNYVVAPSPRTEVLGGKISASSSHYSLLFPVSDSFEAKLGYAIRFLIDSSRLNFDENYHLIGRQTNDIYLPSSTCSKVAN
jgi:hypothetical protein